MHGEALSDITSAPARDNAIEFMAGPAVTHLKVDDHMLSVSSPDPFGMRPAQRANPYGSVTKVTGFATHPANALTGIRNHPIFCLRDDRTCLQRQLKTAQGSTRRSFAFLGHFNGTKTTARLLSQTGGSLPFRVLGAYA
jgi:hypothetical protein